MPYITLPTYMPYITHIIVERKRVVNDYFVSATLSLAVVSIITNITN